MTLTAVRHGVYRLFDEDGSLLYVGVSSTPAARLAEHRGTRWGSAIDDWTVEWFTDRSLALRVETAAILNESPRHNKRRSVDSDKPRTYRAPDDVYEAAADRVWERREKEGLGKPIRLALRAYAADPDAFEAACEDIIGGEK